MFTSSFLRGRAAGLCTWWPPPQSHSPWRAERFLYRKKRSKIWRKISVYSKIFQKFHLCYQWIERHFYKDHFWEISGQESFSSLCRGHLGQNGPMGQNGPIFWIIIKNTPIFILPILAGHKKIIMYSFGDIDASLPPQINIWKWSKMSLPIDSHWCVITMLRTQSLLDIGEGHIVGKVWSIRAHWDQKLQDSINFNPSSANFPFFITKVSTMSWTTPTNINAQKFKWSISNDISPESSTQDEANATNHINLR